MNSLIHQLTCTAIWQRDDASAKKQLPSAHYQFLLNNKSLTQQIKQLDEAHFSIQVLQQIWQAAHAHELVCLQIDPQEDTWIREVALCSNHQELVWARTVIPRDTLEAHQKELLGLENKSLGDYLFNHPELQRGEFEIAFISSLQTWARRSVFYLRDKPLLVTEIFLRELFGRV